MGEAQRLRDAAVACETAMMDFARAKGSGDIRTARALQDVEDAWKALVTPYVVRDALDDAEQRGMAMGLAAAASVVVNRRPRIMDWALQATHDPCRDDYEAMVDSILDLDEEEVRRRAAIADGETP